jgi:hypothetical protein
MVRAFFVAVRKIATTICGVWIISARKTLALKTVTHGLLERICHINCHNFKRIAEAVSIPEVICGSGRNLENCRLI